VYTENLNLYRRIANRSPTTSNFSNSDASRDNTRRIFDEFLKEEFEELTDVEDNEAIK
jgi:hypothetical protein